MNNYYFSFGYSEEYPYRGGYIIIKAESYDQARNMFATLYGRTKHGFLAFAFQYTEEEWNKINCDMGRCHDVIEVHHYTDNR